VDVGVGDPSPDGRDDFAALRRRKLLAGHGRGHDVCGRDRPGTGGVAVLVWRTRLGPRWPGIRLSAAEPDDDAAIHAVLGHVDVRLGHLPLQPTVRQLVVDRLFVVTDPGVELARGPRSTPLAPPRSRSTRP